MSARTGVAFLGIVLCFALIPPAPGAVPEDASKTFLLPNGLKVFLAEKHDLPLVHIAAAVDAGSKDETEATNGVAHLLEHCLLFRGAGARSAAEVDRDVRRHGAYFNANTGQDLIVFEMSLPAGGADYALRNLKEILFDFALTQEALDEEKAVILEEMSRLDDDPMRHGFDLVLQRLFEGHPYGLPILGRPDVIRGARLEALREFHEKYFTADRTALAVVGDFAAPEMEEKIRTVFGAARKQGAPSAPPAVARPLGKTVSFREEKDVKEGYLFIAYVGPAFNDPDRCAMDVLAETLGRGYSPLLSMALSRSRDLFNRLETSYIPGRRGGAFVVSVALEPDNIGAAAREITNYLKGCREENFSREDFPPGEQRDQVIDFLGNAKSRIRLSSEQAEESGLVLASSVARFLVRNERENPGRFLDQVGRMSSADLRRAAGAYFGRGQYAVVSIVPKPRAEGKGKDEK